MSMPNFFIGCPPPWNLFLPKKALYRKNILSVPMVLKYYCYYFDVKNNYFATLIFIGLQMVITDTSDKTGIFNKLTSVFHAPALLLIMNFVMTLSK